MSGQPIMHPCAAENSRREPCRMIGLTVVGGWWLCRAHAALHREGRVVIQIGAEPAGNEATR